MYDAIERAKTEIAALNEKKPAETHVKTVMYDVISINDPVYYIIS